MSRLSYLCSLLLIVGTSANAQAGWVVNLGPIVGSSGVGTVDVTIFADKGGEKNLDIFGLEFFISPGTSGLAFAAVQSNSQTSDPSYVFAPEKVGFIAFKLTPTSYSGFAAAPDDGGFPPNFPGVTVPVGSSNKQLMVRVDLTWSDLSTGDFSLGFFNSPDTFFATPLPNVELLSRSVTASQINVDSDPAVNAVPEPTSLSLFVMGGVGIVAYGRRYRRQRLAVDG